MNLQDIGVRTKAILASYKAESSGDLKESNIIYQMLDSNELTPKDKSEWRLALEIRTFVGAGTETTGNTLSVTAFHLLSDPEKARKLKEEVRAAQKESSTLLTYQELARLPYLVYSPFRPLFLAQLTLNAVVCNS